MKLKIETGTDNAILRAKSVAVTTFDENLKTLATDMLETMRKADGIGLAAPQIGKNIRLVVMDYALDKKRVEPLALVNPEILERGIDLATAEEGCLSLPKKFDRVTRYDAVKVRYRTLDGTTETRTMSGMNARCIQHEIDHLDGILFVDRTESLVTIPIRVL